MSNVCIFCGSRPGTDPTHGELSGEVGRRLAQAGHRIIYGGASVGLMGTLADAALAEGGEVIGVIPRSLVDREVAHTGLTEQIIVDSLTARKTRMIERSDVFVTLPGGIGTLDELFEVWTMAHLGLHSAPLVVLDPGDYYTGLFTFLDRAVTDGFLRHATRADLQRVRSASELLTSIGSVQTS